MNSGKNYYYKKLFNFLKTIKQNLYNLKKKY